ncbi:MAG: chemotaxis protein CheX [Vulcanimicrobiota bacterium]
MKADQVKPFAQAAYDVLKEIIEGPVTRGKLSLMQSPVSVHGVVVIIGLTGGVEGRVLFDMNMETAKKIAEIMNYEEFETFNSLCRATISELGNIIAGRAVSMLNDGGYNFNITPPVLFVGEKMETSDIVQDTLVIPLETDHGTINVNVALKSGK